VTVYRTTTASFVVEVLRESFCWN